MKTNRSAGKVLFAIVLLCTLILAGCGSKEEAPDPGIEDGTYIATFTTDSSMFHVNEANQDMGVLTVKDGKMTIHISLVSKKIVNLFPGTAEDAAKDGAELLEPTTDTVTYSDGYTEEVYGFDVPVPALDEEFDLALIGGKDKWYDHKVKVSNPVPGDDIQKVISEAGGGTDTASAPDLAEGEHQIDVTLDGGSGKASVTSPAIIRVADGSTTAVIEWSSPHYDYMIVDGEKYLPVNEEGNSVFEIPVTVFDAPMEVVADTTAMSEPHEIEYTLTFDSSSVK